MDLRDRNLIHLEANTVYTVELRTIYRVRAKLRSIMRGETIEQWRQRERLRLRRIRQQYHRRHRYY